MPAKKHTGSPTTLRMHLSELLGELYHLLREWEADFDEETRRRAAQIVLQQCSDPKSEEWRRLKEAYLGSADLTPEEKLALEQVHRGELLFDNIRTMRQGELCTLVLMHRNAAEDQLNREWDGRPEILRAWEEAVLPTLTGSLQVPVGDVEERLRSYCADVYLGVLSKADDFSAEIARLDGEPVKDRIIRDLCENYPNVAAELEKAAGIPVQSASDPSGQGEAGGKAGSPDKEQKPPTKRYEWLAKALLLRKEHPDWSTSRIANEVGVHRCTLSRSPEYRMAKEVAKQQPTRGHMITDGRTGLRDVEAVSEDHGNGCTCPECRRDLDAE